jgi:ferredoxin
MLSLDIARCVRTTNKFSTCQECLDSCPVNTIVFSNNLPSFIPNDCVNCGGCVGGCPDAAFSLSDFSSINYIFSFLEDKREVLSCKDDIPCLALLSVEEMLSLTLLSDKKLIFDRTHCLECPISKPNEKMIEDRVEEVNFLSEAMQSDKRVSFISVDYKHEKTKSSRRDFLSKANIKDIAKAKHSIENSAESLDEELKEHITSKEDIQKIKQKFVPDRRKLLSMAIRRVEIPTQFHNLDINDISFISQKVLDEDSCTNCQMCYRICPTGALSSNEYGAFIAFDAINCIKCNSCHEVCEPKSLSLKPIFSLEQFFKPSRETLVRFSVKRCDECGMPFVYRGGEMMCNRCLIEEEEAHEIWGIK